MYHPNNSQIQTYINESFAHFYQQKTEALITLTLSDLLPKNLYLLQIKSSCTAGELVTSWIETALTLLEEEFINDFLKKLAIFIAEKTYDGQKSTQRGADLEFTTNDIHYIVTVKTEENRESIAQTQKLVQDLHNTITQKRLSKTETQPVLGICYGKSQTVNTELGYLKVVGKNFWHLISGNSNLYTDIIEPIRCGADKNRITFEIEQSKAINRFTSQFITEFCDENGAIDWVKLVEFNSGNYDLDNFLP